MNFYRIPFVSEPNWDKIEKTPLANLQWTPEVDISAWAQMCYSNNALHLRLSAKESHIVRRHSGPLGLPYEDSCLEFFFCPAANDDRYFNFEFNPNACLLLGFGKDRNLRTRMVLNEAQELFCPQAECSDGFWTITYQIPYTFLRLFFPDFAPKPGTQFRANFYKCGRLTPIPHYLTWNFCDSPAPNFHEPAFFGMIECGEPLEA